MQESFAGGEGGLWLYAKKMRDFGKWFTKNLNVNCFPKFFTIFSGQSKIFSV